MSTLKSSKPLGLKLGGLKLEGLKLEGLHIQQTNGCFTLRDFMGDKERKRHQI